jgi:hypothetical protein
MKLLILLSLLGATTLFADEDLSLRVREEILDQYKPVVVNVSTHGITTLQFPSRIDALDGDGFTSKPDEAVEFSFTPGTNWVSLKSLRPGAEQNLNVIISGHAYPILIRTTGMNDFVVVFRLPTQVAAK